MSEPHELDPEMANGASPCEHLEFEAAATVNRLIRDDEADDSNSFVPFVAEMKIRCSNCGQRFGFHVLDIGLLPDRATISPDALELRVPLVTPEELEMFRDLNLAIRELGGPEE